MPKYLNNNSVGLDVEGISLPSRVSTITDSVIKGDLPDGVTKEADAPFYNFLLVDQDILADGELEIGKDLSGSQFITIELKAVTNDVTVFLSDVTNLPGLRMLEGEVKTFQIDPSMLSRLVFAFKTTGTGVCRVRVYKR